VRGGAVWDVRARHWWHEHQWPIIGLLWLVALGLGCAGLAKHFAAAGEYRSLWDILYRSVRLFVLECEQASDEMSWELEVARFLAPAVAGYTALQGLALLFSEQLAKLGCRLAGGHVVICGLGRKGFRLARAFRDEGHRVVAIESDPDNVNVALCREHGITVLIGDASRPESLRTANVAKASYFFAVCGDDGVNAEAAVHARGLAADRRSGVLSCFVHIVDLALCGLLREKELATRRGGVFRLDFFNVYESGARALLASHPPLHPAAPDGDAAHLLVVGMGRLGESLVVQAARHRREAGAGGGARLRISVVDREAHARVASLCARYPYLEAICDVTAHEMDVGSPEFQTGDILVDANGRCDVTAAYVCLPGDARSLSAALALHRRCRARGHGIPIVARVSEGAGLATLLPDGAGTAGEFGDVHAFALLDETCRPEVLLQSVNETIAQAMHKDYLRHEMAKGHALGSRPAMHPWRDLREDLREANRAQADHLADKLQAFGYGIASLTDSDAEQFRFSDEEAEGMARMEHERWCDERRAQGYSFGSERDDDRKTHPDLVPWEQLSDEAREKDRAMVRDLPAFLAKAGFQVERAGSPDESADGAQA